MVVELIAFRDAKQDVFQKQDVAKNLRYLSNNNFFGADLDDEYGPNEPSKLEDDLFLEEVEDAKLGGSKESRHRHRPYRSSRHRSKKKRTSRK
jgi:hypothetical protein